MSQDTNRHLAAIMFTDIVGYTSLMQQDEKRAVSQRKKHRKVFQDLHKKYEGRIVQYYGDGTLSVFSSAVNASNCAIEIQRMLRDGDPVPLRIGLHLGDIVFDNTEVYGDAVNLASRIESMAVEGSVLLSSVLNDQLKNKTSINTISMGTFDLKNVAQPLEIFALKSDGLVLPVQAALNGKANDSHKSIAVLPFVNMSADVNNEFFSDGITEEIINALAKIKRLKVTSRTSSFYFKNKAMPIKKIAKELGVSAILEGSVRVAGDSLRITAQLIQAEDDYHFWSETWDRKMENIFETQDEISLLIAERFREQFGHFEIQDHLVDNQTSNLTAYELMLKGRYHRNRWNPEDVNKAIEFFEQAITLDPAYAVAFAELADCYSFLGTTGFLPYEEAWHKAHDYSLKARQLDKNIAGVFYQVSNEAFFVEGNYAKSIGEMKKALAIEPNSATVNEFLSFLYIIAGDREQSLKHLSFVLDVNPLSQESQFFKGYYHYMIGEFDVAHEILTRCIAVNDKNIPAHAILPMCMLLQNKLDEAIDYHDEIPQEVVIPEEQAGIKLLGYTMKGDASKEAEYLEIVTDMLNGQNGITASAFIFFHLVNSGKIDEAFDWITQALENNSFVVPLRLKDPIVLPLRNDPRYTELTKKVFFQEGHEEGSRQKKPLLDDPKAENMLKDLMNHFDNNQPYLNPDLTLRSLADEMDVKPNQLSWLINERLDKNFNDLINQHRIKTFKTLAQNPANAGITILGLAYDSGFNSKTTFNTSFKKETGLTPKQYLQSL